MGKVVGEIIGLVVEKCGMGGELMERVVGGMATEVTGALP